MGDKPRVFQARLDGSEPLHEVIPDLSEMQLARLSQRVDALPISDHPQTQPFLADLAFIIQQHRDHLKAERERVSAGQTRAAVKKIQKQAQTLNALLQQLTPQQQQVFNGPLQFDLYQCGELTIEITPWNPHGDFYFSVLSDIRPYFAHLTQELDRLERVCEEVKEFPVAAGRDKRIGPAQFAKAVSQSYQDHFGSKPVLTRDGPFEQLLREAGALAAFHVEDWHQYLVKEQPGR